MASEFEEGVLVGVLVGEGHFGGDGRQPQVTLRMHERHEALFRWLERTFPGGRVYGPYDHGGRRYYQWMARGAFLRDEVLPILRRRLNPSLDGYAERRLAQMCDRYARQFRTAGDDDATTGLPTLAEGEPRAAATTPGRSSTLPGGRRDGARDVEAIFAALRAVHPAPDTPPGGRPDTPPDLLPDAL